MAYCVMNVDKQGRSAVYGLQIEANRKPGDNREFDRSDIVKERTCDNIFLREQENWNRYITQQIRDAGLKERKDSVVMITGVYTASPEWFVDKSPEQVKAYFEDCLDYHDRTYGHAFNAVIHMDETTPHMQVASVPIIEDEKGMHLSAKIIMGGRGDYQKRQDQFYEQVGKQHGLERGERRDPAERKAHTTKREWQEAVQAGTIAKQERKIDSQREELAKIEQKAQEAQKAEQKAQRALEGKIKKIEKLTEQIEKKIVARPPGLFQNKDTVEFHRNMYEAVQENLKDMRKMTKEIAECSDTLERDLEYAKKDRYMAKNERQQAEKMRINMEQTIEDKAQVLAQELFEQMSKQAKADWKRAEKAKEKYETFENRKVELIREAAFEFAKRITAGQETDLAERMRDHMDGITYSDGTTVLDHFEEKEQEREERLARRSREWDWER